MRTSPRYAATACCLSCWACSGCVAKMQRGEPFKTERRNRTQFGRASTWRRPTSPLLSEPWILDMDATVKPLYGHQEEAVLGYHPGKPGRPSHVYHCYFIAAIRLVVEVEVQAGNRTASQYAQPGLWAWLDTHPQKQWPQLLRGDISWGT